jgi:hypothetical protein
MEPDASTAALLVASQGGHLPKKYMNAEETSAFIGIAVQTLARWRSEGGKDLPFIRVSRGRIMYDVDDLTAWMNARRVRSTSEATGPLAMSHVTKPEAHLHSPAGAVRRRPHE